MYLHLGGSVVVPASDVVTIVDARLLGAETNRPLIRHVVAAGGIREEDLRGCKAVVVTTVGIYLSAVSPQSLARRMVALAIPVG